jgi:ComF family protein
MSQGQIESKFVWPPRGSAPVLGRPAESPGLEPPAPSADPSDTPPARISAPRGAMREIERIWLGLVTPPLPERIVDAGWTPDPPAAYCHRCGTTRPPHGPATCEACDGLKFPWEQVVRLGEFQGLLREMVHEVKFTRWRRLGTDLGRMLGRSVGDVLRTSLPVVVVPMPTTFRRRMVRGIDQALVIARGVARELDSPLAKALERQHRPSQTALPRSERIRNLTGSMRLRRGYDLAGQLAVLVDDVTTTRASLVAAARALRVVPKGEPPPRVWAAVLGVTPDAGRPRRRAPQPAPGTVAAGAGS